MKNFENWKGSAITLMGDPGKKRSTIMKVAVMGLIGLMAAKAVIMPFESSINSDLQVKGGVEHSQLAAHMDDVGKRLNAEYGSEHTVIVLKDDANLKFVLANAQAGFFKEDFSGDTFTGKVRTEVTDFVESTLGVKVDRTDMNRGGFYDHLKEGGDAPVTILLGDKGPDPYDALLVVKGYGGPDVATFDNKFPFHNDLDFQNAFSFFHELTHAVDTRDGRVHDEQAQFIDKTIHTEAVADLGMALVFYKQTGNLDDWNYGIKPLRLGLSQDMHHATDDVVDAALKTVDLTKIKDMSDREIMALAKDKMNETVTKMMNSRPYGPGARIITEWNVMRFVDTVYAGKDLVGDGAYNSSLRRLDRVTGDKGFELVRDHGRIVMEASLNNLNYTGKFADKKDDFLGKLSRHIVDYKDEKALNALGAASVNGGFDQMVFAKEMGFKIDYEAANRKDKNHEILTQYFVEKSGQPAFAGFSLETIHHNQSPTVISRYANDSKELTQGQNSYIPHIR